MDLEGATIIDPRDSDRIDAYAEALWKKRQRRGLTKLGAFKELRRFRTVFGMMMVESG